MSKVMYTLALFLLGVAVKWMLDDAYEDGARNKQDAWLDGFQRGVKSVEDGVLREP